MIPGEIYRETCRRRRGVEIVTYIPGRDCWSVCVCSFFFGPVFFNVDFQAMMSWWCSCPTKLVQRTLGEARGKRSNVHSSRLKVFCVFRSISTIMTWTVGKILSTDNPSLHRSRSSRSTRGTLRDSGQSGSLRGRRLEVFRWTKNERVRGRHGEAAARETRTILVRNY